MKLLLASAGVTTPAIHAALERLLGKPVGESDALCIPTAAYVNPGGAQRAWNFVAGAEPRCPMTELGWRSVGILELTALSSMGEERWWPAVRSADVLLVNGGDALFLVHWLQESGLAARLDELDDTVWVGLSAGSMALTPRIGEDFVGWRPPTGGDAGLGLVDFSIFPHVDHPELTENTMLAAEAWASDLGNAAYAIDDATALVVENGEVEVVSDGTWRHFPAADAR